MSVYDFCLLYGLTNVLVAVASFLNKNWLVAVTATSCGIGLLHLAASGPAS